ncbi:MerR family transcriptional regulator [Ruania halotolerans]|uniref:MerR family transcriptional regulator n=1 Tax=Ruania halotolerans TaxID=2897773 RepID=UPI001E60D6F0|nr:MerR family transcriptional regulator [Ruania halotolerans]UFU05682.1 MerR family transcriptional regulator [Ruania halotolerans]
MARSGSNEREYARIRLTVAAVAGRLGVAASTLRTWDRRYGLGPSSRTAGQHRRYNAEDITRLETMRRLTREGVAPADAARLARGLAVDEAVPEVDEEGLHGILDPLSLAAAAVETEERRLHRMVHRSVRESGGLSAWQNLVRPALDLLEARDHGDRAGRDPVAALGAALLAAVRDEAPASEMEARVMIYADLDHHLDAHVLAGELLRRGIGARVLRPARRSRTSGSVAVASDPHVQLAVLLGEPRDALAVAEAMHASDRLAFVISLTGVRSPMADLPRARTLAGAVHEIVSLLADQVPLHPSGRSS